MSIAKVRYIGKSNRDFTNGNTYDAYCIEFVEGVRDGIVVKNNDGYKKDLNHLRDFEILNDPDNVLNSYYAVVECTTHDYDDEFLAVLYGKLYKAIGQDKYGNYLIEDDEMCCYFYSCKDFQIIYDPHFLLGHTSIEYDYGGPVEEVGGPCLEMSQSESDQQSDKKESGKIFFTEGSKSLKISIVSYESDLSELESNEFGEKEYRWLVIRADYEDQKEKTTYYDPAITVKELSDLVYELEMVTDGRETGLIFEPMEPNFRFVATKAGEDLYAIQVLFIKEISPKNRKELHITQSMSLKELKTVYERFKEESLKFSEQ